jgi:alkyl hydroperoxide reductase subunit AhpC
MARMKPEFDKRNVKVIGLSVDSVDDHARWARDIQDTQGMAPNYPVIGDSTLSVSKLYDMLPAETPGTAAGRTPADNQTVRTVFVIGPDKKVKLELAYPMTTGRNFDEVLRVIDEAGRGRDHRRVGVRRRRAAAVPGGLDGPETVHPDRPPAAVADRPPSRRGVYLRASSSAACLAARRAASGWRQLLSNNAGSQLP